MMRLPEELLLRSRFRGCLLGVATGDALGAPFEGAPPSDGVLLQSMPINQDLLSYTDDTHMTIGVAESLVALEGRFDGTYMSQILARNFREQPWRGYGAGPPIVFDRLRAGTPWEKAAKGLFGGMGSYGNGSAMRVAPVALATFGDLQETVAMARQTSRITHTHELALQGAALQACAVGLLLQESQRDQLDVDSFLDRLSQVSEAPEYFARLEEIRTLLDRPDPGQVVTRLGNGVEAIRSVPTALYCFLRHPLSFEEVVTEAVGLGGDTDTIASMAGALAGAYLGEKAIPLRWRDRLEDADRLVELADSLFLLISRGSGSPVRGNTTP